MPTSVWSKHIHITLCTHRFEKGDLCHPVKKCIIIVNVYIVLDMKVNNAYFQPCPHFDSMPTNVWSKQIHFALCTHRFEMRDHSAPAESLRQ